MRPWHPLLALLVCCFCCATDKAGTDSLDTNVPTEQPQSGKVRVTEVSVEGNENDYTFSVTLESPDTGCAQYADWWEIIGLDGTLIYRRILTHSHVGEQPFSRAGGPVNIGENIQVYVRAHMNNTGYGSSVFKGSVATGFLSEELDPKFAKELESQVPLPSGCAF